MNNPDEGHYCGKCGGNIAAYGHVWRTYDSSKYGTYVSSGNTVISNSRLNELTRYERKAMESPWKKVKEWISDIWDNIYDYFDENGWKWGLGFCGVIALIGVIAALKDCSSSSKKDLMRIEVDGKYGIGYDKDNLLVPAKYASIAEKPTGTNQWLINDPATGLEGLAYVTDSIRNVIEPEFDDVQIGYGRYSLLRKSPRDVRHMGEYEYVAKDGKILNEFPFNGIKAVGTFNDFVVFLDRNSNNQYQLYNRNLDKIGPEYNSMNPSFKDGVLIARGRDESVLYDFTGNILTHTPLRYVKNFSDGVSWAYITKSDYQNDRVSLIDKYGKTFFSVYANKNSYPVDFSEGIGWYKNTKGLWVAVDKTGRELFDIGAYSVYPFTMGLAPVYKGSSYRDRKLGFVDKTGKTVIPFKYEATASLPIFDSDSLMSVTLDGKGGKLHRNGTFYPGK